jgi:hypothetical protein
MLTILVSWLVALFISFGLYAPTNGTVVTSLLVSALSASCAILLILELYSPYRGLIITPSTKYVTRFSELRTARDARESSFSRAWAGLV